MASRSGESRGSRRLLWLGIIALALLVWLYWPSLVAASKSNIDWAAIEFFPWVGSWFIPWAQTPGFGGAAAVVAAGIAFFAARHQAGLQREAQRKEQWWKRAEWALTLVRDDSSGTRTIGYDVLEALGRSEYAAEHEAEFIAAATKRAFDDIQLDGEAPAEFIWRDGEPVLVDGSSVLVVEASAILADNGDDDESGDGKNDLG